MNLETEGMVPVSVGTVTHCPGGQGGPSSSVLAALSSSSGLLFVPRQSRVKVL